MYKVAKLTHREETDFDIFFGSLQAIIKETFKFGVVCMFTVHTTYMYQEAPNSSQNYKSPELEFVYMLFYKFQNTFLIWEGNLKTVNKFAQKKNIY